MSAPLRIADKPSKAPPQSDPDRRRTLLAKERTYSSWVRTGLSAEAAGLAIARWLNSPEPGWLAPVLGALLVLIGALIFIVAFTSYRSAFSELARGEPASRLVAGLTTALAVSALLALALIVQW